MPFQKIQTKGAREIMNTEKLFEVQEKVDAAIAANMHKEWEGFGSFESVEHRKFALRTEIFELANEIGFFKDWKHSHKIDKEAALEELGDCIAFLLSLGITAGYQRIASEIRPFEMHNEYAWEDLFDMLTDLRVDNAGKFTLIFSLLLGIGLKIGATESEIVDAYMRKSNINIERREKGY